MKLGAKRWSLIAGHLKGRIGKQCRERCVGAWPAIELFDIVVILFCCAVLFCYDLELTAERIFQEIAHSYYFISYFVF